MLATATSTVMVEDTTRAYYPIWKSLRDKGEVTIAVLDPVFLSRIKRMISKEKDEDLGFKIMNGIEKPRLQFFWNEDKKELRIVLKSKYNLVAIIK